MAFGVLARPRFLMGVPNFLGRPLRFGVVAIAFEGSESSRPFTGTVVVVVRSLRRAGRALVLEGELFLL